jgi:error-prone DNA polymerase
MVRGLANAQGAAIVAGRADRPFTTLLELRRRTRVPVAALVQLAEADALRGLGLDRRRALWEIKGLHDTTLPLFAAAEEEEPAVALAPMTEGGAVVEDYRSTGLTLRRHPVAFLRAVLRRGGHITCKELAQTRDGRRVRVPGIVLVRQRPGSAQGVMFITIEDETGIANLIVWPAVFERQRRLILSATMIGCFGRLQREGEVIHVIAERLEDLSGALRGVGQLGGEAFAWPTSRGDEARHGGAPDPRGEIRVATRDFR